MANIMRLGGGVGGSKPKMLLSSLTEGSLVSVLEDGKLVPFYVAKHDYEADLNGEGRTLLVRKNLHSKAAWHTVNTNAYATSSVDSLLNSDYKKLLSNTVKAQMGVTSFLYTVGGKNATVSTLQRSVFLLSVTELGFTKTSVNVEGEALPIASALHIATLDGAATRWWTRSPNSPASDGMIACMLLASGAADQDYVTNTYGIRPCFTLPATMALNESPNADGSWTLADEVTIDVETASTTAKSGVNYTNGIADLDAATLHEIGMAISSNPNITNEHSVVYYDKDNVHRKISVGDEQNITVEGTAYAVNIIGFNHDELTNGAAYGNPTATGKAGLTFQLVKALNNTEAMNSTNTNAGGWTSSVMRTSYMSAYLVGLSSALRSAIKFVNKLTCSYSSDATTVTEDKLFLLSEMEVFGLAAHSYGSADGEQYAYYKAGNSAYKITANGGFAGWWERTPAAGNTSVGFCAVNGSGTYTKMTATSKMGIAFAYCI